jgi:hypothetical protein
MIRTAYPQPTSAELEQWERDARRFQGAYTGTAGTLAAHVIRLLAEVQRLKEHARASDGNRPVATER